MRITTAEASPQYKICSLKFLFWPAILLLAGLGDVICPKLSNVNMPTAWLVYGSGRGILIIDVDR